MRPRIGINGFGTIGIRLTEVLSRHPGVEFVGAVKLHPDFKASQLTRAPFYIPPNTNPWPFQEAGILVKGTLDDLLQRVDLIFDCTPAGTGQTYQSLYQQYGVKVVFQGGEDLEVAPLTLFAPVNFAEVAQNGFDRARVGSCNENAQMTVIASLLDLGPTHIFTNLVRRAADSSQKATVYLNALEPKLGAPHYADTIQQVFGNQFIYGASAWKAPVTQMHGHSLWMRFEKGVTAEKILHRLAQNPRILLVSAKQGHYSTATVAELGLKERPFGNIYEVAVWSDSLQLFEDGRWINLLLAVDQKAVVIPTNLDALWALTGIFSNANAAMRATNQFLGIGNLRI